MKPAPTYEKKADLKARLTVSEGARRLELRDDFRLHCSVGLLELVLAARHLRIHRRAQLEVDNFTRQQRFPVPEFVTAHGIAALVVPELADLEAGNRPGR